jgi:hypothetical protein
MMKDWLRHRLAGAWRGSWGGSGPGAAGAGALLAPRRCFVRLPEEEHYRRYPEEEIIDTLRRPAVSLRRKGKWMSHWKLWEG